MIGSPDIEFWHLMERHIRERREDRTDRVTRGGCQSYEEYRGDVGYLAALTDIEALARQVFEDMTNPRPVPRPSRGEN